MKEFFGDIVSFFGELISDISDTIFGHYILDITKLEKCLNLQ
jgi:hypothetical protein